ncbi:MAG TPA: hypothetical protein VGX92_18605 [Pyrinomonadaceae bacterium]|jgi:hypothetical protein|nr:hypothetical protein [Pyrinomonadaceae bacterium]
MRKFCNVGFIILAFASQLALVRAQANTPKSSGTATSTPAAQSKDYPNLKAQAEELAEAFLRRDFYKVASLTYPKAVRLMGGRARMVAFLNRSMKQAEAENVRILSNTVGEPKEIIRVGRQLFAIIPATLKMKVPGGTLTGQSFLIGISNDDGENWTFVDSAGVTDRARLKTLFPAAADKLKIPEVKPPILERES